MSIISQDNNQAVLKAMEFLSNGKVIGIPTDTVYGLAVDATNPIAIENLYNLKKRDKNKPIAIFLKNIEQIEKLFMIEEITANLIKKHLPGKLTIVARTNDEAKNKLAKNLNENNQDFLGFRVVDNFFIKKLFDKFDGILAVTSANISGDKIANSADEIKKIFPKLDLIIAGDVANSGASSVVKVENGKLITLRAGTIKI